MGNDWFWFWVVYFIIATIANRILPYPHESSDSEKNPIISVYPSNQEHDEPTQLGTQHERLIQALKISIH